jgi:type I restriction enzyme S subunit
MDAQTFLSNSDVIAEAPGGVDRLRQLILDLAVRGMLVTRDASDEPAQVLLDRVRAEKSRQVATGAVPRPRKLDLQIDEQAPMFTIPESWTWACVDDIASYIQRGKGPRYVDVSGIPVVSQKCVQWSGFDLNRARFVDERTLEKYGPERFLQVGDLLWNSTGTGTVGRVNVFPGPGDFSRVVADSHVTVIRIAICLPQYVYWWLASRHVQATIDDITSGTTKQQELNTSTVRSQPIPIPPLAEQGRIVAKVDGLMQLCDDLEARQQAKATVTTRFRASALDALPNAETDTDLAAAWTRVQDNWETLTDLPDSVDDIRHTVLELAVRGSLVEYRSEELSSSDTLALIEGDERQGLIKRKTTSPVRQDEMPFRVPASWRWVRFADVVDSRLGKMLDKAKNTGPFRPYLRNANVQWFRFDLDDVAELRLEDAELDEFSLRIGDLVVCEGGEPGRAAVCDEHVEGMLFQKALHRIRPYRGISPHYLAFVLRCDAANGRLSSYFTGATIKHLTGRSLASYPIPLPPVDEQERIVMRICELMRLCDDLDGRLRKRETVAGDFAVAAVHHVAS